MSKIMDYLSLYFGNKDISEYPGISKVEKRDIAYFINLAQSSRIFDPGSEPRSTDWRSL